MSLKRKVDGEFIDIAPSGGGTELPPIDTPGKVLETTEDGKMIWSNPKNNFRGEWAPDELAMVSDFSGGISSPFAARPGIGPGAKPVVADSPVPSGQPYQGSVLMSTQPTGPDSVATLRLNLTASGVVNPSRCKFWYKSLDAFSSFEDWARLRVVSGAAQLFMGWNLNWTEAEAVIPAGATYLDFKHSSFEGSTGVLTGSYVTGVRLYSIVAPYMLGDFVTHDGEMWKSLVNNNTETPSKTSNAWSRALRTPPPSGTTAERPDPEDAGAGYQYFDTDLNRPVWSNGAEWADPLSTIN